MVAPALVFAGGVAVGAAFATNALRARLARRRPRRVLVGPRRRRPRARLATSHIARKKKKKSGRTAEPKDKTSVGVFTNHTGVCPRTGRHVLRRVRPWTSRGVRARARFQGRENAPQTSEREKKACVDGDQKNGDKAALARVIARADVDCVVFAHVGARFYTYLSSVYDVRGGARGSTTEAKAKARAKAKAKARAKAESARRGETTRREEEREKNTNAERGDRRVRVVVIAPTSLGGFDVHGGPRGSIEPGFVGSLAAVAAAVPKAKARHDPRGDDALLFNSKSHVGADPDKSHSARSSFWTICAWRGSNDGAGRWRGRTRRHDRVGPAVTQRAVAHLRTARARGDLSAGGHERLRG